MGDGENRGVGKIISRAGDEDSKGDKEKGLFYRHTQRLNNMEMAESSTQRSQGNAE